MTKDSSGGDRHGVVAAVAVTVMLLVVGVVALVLGLRGSDGPPQPVAAAPAATASTPTGSTAPGPAPTSPRRSPQPRSTPQPPATAPAKEPKTRIETFLPAARPTKIEIPSVDISSDNFVDLEVAKDGTLDVPGSADEVGLYADGPTPGQLGPAVLGAHVDSTKGPGIFYRLGAVKRGAKIHITRADRTRTTFVVDKVAVYPKDDFPTDQVYFGDFTRPEIRLVTCGGTFDRVKHYLGNVVVFGHLVT